VGTTAWKNIEKHLSSLRLSTSWQAMQFTDAGGSTRRVKWKGCQDARTWPLVGHERNRKKKDAKLTTQRRITQTRKRTRTRFWRLWTGDWECGHGRLANCKLIDEGEV